MELCEDFQTFRCSDYQIFRKMRRTAECFKNINFQYSIFNFWHDVFITLRSVMEMLAFVTGLDIVGYEKNYAFVMPYPTKVSSTPRTTLPMT